MALFRISLVVTQPTLTTTTGSITIEIGGTQDRAISIYIPRSAMTAAATMTPGPNNTASFALSGIPVGQGYSGVCFVSGDSATLPFDFDIVAAAPPVPGCTDPDADNYDPNATQDNGSCVFTPRLTLAALPELAPVGVPLVVALSGAAVVGAAPAPASVLLDLANLLSTAASNPALTAWVRVDGYLFTLGPLIVPGRFVDVASLLDAMAAQPALAASYVLQPVGATSLRLTARVPGLPGTPTVSVSSLLLVAVTPTAGVAALWSQRRYNWGCYLEVWAGCGSVFGGVVDKATAVLAQRLELDYRADNAYAFDIASALSQYTGHAYPLADGSCPDRLVSYFVRFGEQYAQTPTGPRQARNSYESEVAWGIEAMEVLPPIAGRYVLSARPGPWVVAAGAKVPLWQLAKPDADARTLLRYRLATSRSTTDVVLGHEVATGQVTQAGDKLLAPAGVLSGELRTTNTASFDTTLLAAVQFGAVGPALTFANRQGGFDTQYFGGVPDENTKRTAGSFTNAGGAQLLSAEAALPTRLYSGLLDYATWVWLRRELTTSPAAWLDGLPVRLTDVAADGDTSKGEYSVSLDYETAPVRGLSN